MPPVDLKDFFIATAGASATFIGLLFVAMSFVLNDSDETEQQRGTKRILAESSYAALINIFFISLIALIPNITLGYVMIAMGWAGIGNGIHFLRLKDIIRRSRAPVFGGGLLYLLEVAYGVFLITRPDGYVISVGIIITLFMFLFVGGLTRAWELTGIRSGVKR